MSSAENGDDDIDGGEQDGVMHTNRCLNLTLRVLLSTPGLVLLVVIYSIIGALIFPLFEAPTELHNAMAVIKSRDECLKELWTITGEWGCQFGNCRRIRILFFLSFNSDNTPCDTGRDFAECLIGFQRLMPFSRFSAFRSNVFHHFSYPVCVFAFFRKTSPRMAASGRAWERKRRKKKCLP